MPTGPSESHLAHQLIGFVERTSDVVGIVDHESRVVYLNDTGRKRLGVSDIAGFTTNDLFPPAAFTKYYEEVRPALLRYRAWHGELALLAASGEVIPMDVTVTADVGPGGEVRTLVAFGRELGRASASSGPDAEYDELTGLPGRGSLDQRLAAALARRTRDGRGVAVIFADVDGMTEINETFGRPVGDSVLKRIARVMSHAMRTGDTVARVGGDEFVVLLEGLEENDTAWEVTERLRNAVCAGPDDRSDDAPVVTTSLGLVIVDPGEAPEELLRRADSAMRRAAGRGRRAGHRVRDRHGVGGSLNLVS